ncbi:hypothetical protein HZA43_06150 [Candidatus Peregrinibacteria bacterium]|nr:hypothetical protein [Candidatus Peregrinibacteria bacterium]
METIYRWDVIGNRKLLLGLEQEIKDNNIVHAYLFAGPRQIGKHRLARTFAEILQCPNGYCRTCDTCRRIQKRCHPDVIFMDDTGDSIKIDEIRDLIQKTHLSVQGRYRIILIENIERMPIEAQNSFLKILEEPPAKTVFILTTSEIDQVLPTIQSRTRNYFLSTLDDDAIRRYLNEKFGEISHLDDIVNMAQGRPGMAIRLAEGPELLEYQQSLYRQIERILSENDVAGKIAYAEELEKEEGRIDQFLDAFIRYLRKLMYDYLDHPDAHPLRSRFSLENIVDLFESVQKTRYLMDRNVNKRLALENLMLKTEK